MAGTSKRRDAADAAPAAEASRRRPRRLDVRELGSDFDCAILFWNEATVEMKSSAV